MAITVFSIDDDNVIRSKFITGMTTYGYALKHLVPLIDKLDIQRKIQDARFYRRLERDLLQGCIMPPLTLAFIRDAVPEDTEELKQYINNEIDDAFVLDGIQRLNTLQRTYRNNSELNLERPLFLNILICQSMDNLLYRMITLNNGQKAMTARHQIEILANNIYDFDGLSIQAQSEKERKKRVIRGAFNRSSIIKGYIAFLSNSTNIDNQRIIEEKLDELIADKILNSNITQDNLEFSDIIGLIDRFGVNPDVLTWFKNNENNLIGFCVGIRESYTTLSRISTEDFKTAIDQFEGAFHGFNVSKLRVGQQRRKLVEYFISHFNQMGGLSETELLDKLSEVD